LNRPAFQTNLRKHATPSLQGRSQRLWVCVHNPAPNNLAPFVDHANRRPRQSARDGGDLEHSSAINRRDVTGWLGWEDSNLRMAESKSDNFGNEFKARSEKYSIFHPRCVNRLLFGSEYVAVY
jgi:hypothetical protein